MAPLWQYGGMAAAGWATPPRPRVIGSASSMEKPGGITRRTAFRAAAGAGIGVAAALSPGLPAWARPILKTLDVKGPGALPNPSLPEGTPTMPQIEHIVVVMMENHSFDNIIGMVPNNQRTAPPLHG